VSATLLRSGRSRITRGDALVVLGGVPDAHFDTIFCDWPYSQASPVRGKDDGAAARVYGPVSFLARILQECARVARPGAHLYLFGDWKGIPDAGYAMSLSGWFPTTIIAWDKCYTGTGGTWRSGWDPIFFASKGPAVQRTDKAYPNVVRTPAVRAGRVHPYEKPRALWDAFCRVSVAPGVEVLDLFAGSGSSCPPTEAAGGTWYGIDVDPAFSSAAPEGKVLEGKVLTQNKIAHHEALRESREERERVREQLDDDAIRAQDEETGKA
jgi:DNA modification methylase